METVHAYRAGFARSSNYKTVRPLARNLLIGMLTCSVIACKAPTSNMSPAPETQFEGSTGSVTIQGLSDTSSLCFTTDGSDPGWENDSCSGATATLVQGPIDYHNITISCAGQIGAAVLRQVTVAYEGYTTPNKFTSANYYLNCDVETNSDDQDDSTSSSPGNMGNTNGENSKTDAAADNTSSLGNSTATLSNSSVSRVADIKIVHNDDDAEQRSNGNMYLNSSDLELNDDVGSDEDDQIVGLRFLLNDGQIPQGSTISRAYIQFTTKSSRYNYDGSKRIKGQDSDSTQRFDSVRNNISSRPKTHASSLWQPSAWNEDDEAGSDQRTSELKHVIQEIIDRPNWDEASLAFIITGSGTRSAWSHDGRSSRAAVLHVEYETEASGGDDNAGGSAGSGQNTLTNKSLARNEYLESNNGDYRLYLQGDGNLVLRDWQTRDAIWSTRTHSTSASRLTLQSDGNLVLYTNSGQAVWASRTVGSGASSLVLNDNGSLVLYALNDKVWSINDSGDTDSGGGDDDNDNGGGDNSSGRVTHIGTTEIYDSNGQNMRISRPSGSKSGDLLVLALHRTDDDLPLIVDGWTRAAECYKRDNGYDCVGYDDCTAWANGKICSRFGDYGRGGHDLAQAIFYKSVGSNEPSSYTFNLNVSSGGHPGWAILTALRGANNSDPIRDTANEGCDDNSDSLFPSVYGVAGDMVLLSQSFDDAVSQSKFGAPDGTTTFGYVSQSDEAGFLFGGVLDSTGETGEMKTRGEGASSCKDALVSLTIKAQ